MFLMVYNDFNSKFIVSAKGLHRFRNMHRSCIRFAFISQQKSIDFNKVCNDFDTKVYRSCIGFVTSMRKCIYFFIRVVIGFVTKRYKICIRFVMISKDNA